MATATKATTQVPKKITILEDQTTVTLVMSDDEAKTLRAVLGRIGGGNFKTRRRYINTIFNALEGAGYVQYLNEDVQGQIHFVDTTASASDLQ
jgi:hypothetical protein